MKDAVFWWTGATVWAGVGAMLACLALEFLVGFACAVSWCHWSYRMLVAVGEQPKWRTLPKAFLRRWWELSGHRNNGDTTWTGENGYWRGIGDWKVTPPNA